MGRETIGICSARPPWRIVLYYFSVLAALLESITSPPLQLPFFFFFSFLFFLLFHPVPPSYLLLSFSSHRYNVRATSRIMHNGEKPSVSSPSSHHLSKIYHPVRHYLSSWIYALSLCIICDIIRNKDKKILFIKKGGAIRWFRSRIWAFIWERWNTRDRHV